MGRIVFLKYAICFTVIVIFACSYNVMITGGLFLGRPLD
jgi:hypothetical protein